MAHFGRSGPPAIRDSFSLLVLNVSFRTTADDLFPLFDRCGDVVDIYIPRDRRTGDSRGFAFVRYKYEDEAQRAVDKLDGRTVDGRDIVVQFAKYGPNAERIQKGRIVEEVPKPRGRSRSRSPRPSQKGRIVEEVPKPRGRSRSRSPRPRYRDDYRDRDYRRRSRSRSAERYERDRPRDKEYRRRSMSRSVSPDYDRRHSRRNPSPARRSPSRSRSCSPRRMPPQAGTPSKPGHHRSPVSQSRT